MRHEFDTQRSAGEHGGDTSCSDGEDAPPRPSASCPSCDFRRLHFGIPQTVSDEKGPASSATR